MRLAYLIIGLFLSSFTMQRDSVTEKKNIEEYHRAVKAMEASIWSLPGYIIDTSLDHWTARDPKGFYSFEGNKSKPDDYFFDVTIKGYIYSSAYFGSEPKITCRYIQYRDYAKNDTAHREFDINCGSDAFGDLPFTMNNVKAVYVQKTLSYPSSGALVFDRWSIDESYVVTYKNGSVKKFFLDNHREFVEEK